MKKWICSAILVCLLCCIGVSALADSWSTFHFTLSSNDSSITIDNTCRSLRTGSGKWRIKINAANPGQAQGRGVFFNCYRTSNQVKAGVGIWVKDKKAHNGSWSGNHPIQNVYYSPAARADNQLSNYSVVLSGYFDAQQLGTSANQGATWW